MSENAIKSINIPEKVLMDVIQYLGTCPYNQVNGLIKNLSIAIQIQINEEKEKKLPVKHPTAKK